MVFDQDNSGQWRFLFIKSKPYAYFEEHGVWITTTRRYSRGITWLVLGLAALFWHSEVRNGPAKAATLTLSTSAQFSRSPIALRGSGRISLRLLDCAVLAGSLGGAHRET